MRWLLREERSSILYSAIVMVLLGIILVVFPQITMRVAGYILGGLLLFLGAVQIARYFMDASGMDLFRHTLILGLLAVTFGILVLVGPEVVLSILPFLFGLAVLMGSFMKIQYALNLKVAGYGKWWWILVMALIAMILGILIITNPFASLVILVTFIGISLMVGGITDIWTYAQLMRQIKKLSGK